MRRSDATTQRNSGKPANDAPAKNDDHSRRRTKKKERKKMKLSSNKCARRSIERKRTGRC